jgi:hypothetical protein
MYSPTRTVAAALLVGIVLLTAGCNGIQYGDDPSNEILLVNQDDTDHAVVVEIAQVSDDPDPVYATGRTLDAESQATLDPFDGTGEYRVTVTVDGDATELTHSFESGDAVVTIGIDNQGAVSIE